MLIIKYFIKKNNYCLSLVKDLLIEFHKYNEIISL